MNSTYAAGEKRKTMASSIFNGLKINSEFQDFSPLTTFSTQLPLSSKEIIKKTHTLSEYFESVCKAGKVLAIMCIEFLADHAKESIMRVNLYLF